MTDINTVNQLTSEVDLFGPILQQTVLLNKFDCEFAPLASLQQGAPIEFMVKGADQLYLNLYESLPLVRVKLTNADNSDIAADTGFSELEATLTVQSNERGIQRNACERTESPVHILSIPRDVDQL